MISSADSALPRWLEGRGKPPQLADDLHGFEQLPQPVRDDFWQVLQPNLAAKLDDRVSAQVAKFCRSREVKPELLVGPVRGGRWLIYQATRHDVSIQAFAKGVGVVGGDCARDVLGPCYEKARPMMRQRIVQAALSEHGKLVRGMGWRVDTIRRSHSGGNINVPVALMTFRYTEGSKDETITLQMLPEALEDLRMAIAEITQ